MSYTSKNLQMTLQNLDDNPDTWGDVLNQSGIELIEDSIAGLSVISLISAADYTMDTTIGGDASDHYRRMIINISGTPGGATNILVPDDTSLGLAAGEASGLYLAFDGTTGGDVITLQTVNGAGIALISGGATWCYCDGTDIVEAQVKTSQNSATSTLATDSLSLGGVLAAGYGQLGVQQSWTAGQSTLRVDAVEVTNIVTCDVAESNAFYTLWSGFWTLGVPSNPINGATFSIVIEQDTAGSPPYTIDFALNTFIWPSGSEPELSVTTGAIDYLAFEYVSDITGGARWIGTIIKAVA